MLLEVAVVMMIPLLMSSIIDDGVEKGDIHHIYVVGAAMLVLAAGPVCGRHGRPFRRAGICGTRKNLREAMYENIQGYSFSNIDN